MSRTCAEAAVVGPQVQFDSESLRISYSRLFNLEAGALVRRFARRVFGFPEVHSISIDPQTSVGEIGYRVGKNQLRDFITRLASAVEGSGTELEDSVLPQWPANESVTLYRFEDLVSRWRIVSRNAGHLQLRHPVLTQDVNFARRTESALRSVCGVTRATATTTRGNLWVRFDPDLIGAKELVRIADSQFTRSMQAPAVPDPKPVDFRLANTTVGVATVGELILPLAEALGAGLLVIGQLNTMRDAASQLRAGKLGTPVWLSALLICSIASGQVLAYALTDWSFRYWKRRGRRDLMIESRILVEETAPVPSHARIQPGPNAEVWRPVEQIRPDESLSVEKGDVIAVDGRVISGCALVQEGTLGGSRAPLTKSTGDEVFAGSTIFQGKLEIEPLRFGQETRNARIAQALLKSVASMPGHRDLTQQAEALVDRTTGPILATAGVGLAVGGLFTAGAIMHQDWLSVAELAVPLETLRTMRLAAGEGVVILDPDALRRLSESDFIVFDDRPALLARGFELDRLESRLNESETDSLLCHAAGAGLYLGDERAFALAQACRQRKRVVRRPSLLALEPNRVTTRSGAHTVALRTWPAGSKAAAPPLTVEIDGIEVASLQFRYRDHPNAAASIRQLRKLGFEVFLASDRSNHEAKERATALGIELYSGGLSTAEQVRFLQSLRRRGLRPTYVADFRIRSEVARAAHLSISPASVDLAPEMTPDILLFPGETIDPLPTITHLAREHPSRIKQSCNRAMIPNLLCVAGGFGGVLNGITAGILGNIAVLGVYRHLSQSLKSIDAFGAPKRISL